MSQHDDFFQRQKPAAVLKHAVLDEYLNVFATMVGQPTEPLWLIDGYAGPGAYAADEDGEEVPGSPLVALRIAEMMSTRTGNAQRRISCAFIEREAKLFVALEQNIEPYRKRGLPIVASLGDVSDHLASVWKEVGESPALTLLDPFGVSMSSDALVGTLLRKRVRPSEVLLNINVEALWRHGGALLRAQDGTIGLKSDASVQGVEKADDFLGGKWWHEIFVDERERTDSAALAASAVVNAFRSKIESAADVKSMSVPIRRRAGQQPLFLLTLFYRHPAAGYKFADASARATRKWRDAYRARDIEDFFNQNDEASMLPGMGDVVRSYSQDSARAAEKQMYEQNLELVVANIRALLDEKDG